MHTEKLSGTWYTHQFMVEGSGVFPVDMLRYDRCYPATEADSLAILEDRDRRKVILIKVGARGWAPTAGRWNSFGWKVVG